MKHHHPLLLFIGLTCCYYIEAQNTLRLNILSLGKQFNKKTFEGAHYTELSKKINPTVSGGIAYYRTFKKQYILGIQLSYESGSIGRRTHYFSQDSVNGIDYTSLFSLKYLSYGIGLHLGYQLGKHQQIKLNINSYTLSAQSYYWNEEVINNGIITNIITEERYNDLDANEQFLQIGFEYERYLDQSHIHSVILSASKSFGKPLYGGKTLLVNNQIIEQADFKINYGNIKLGYCYNIQF